MKLLLLLTLSCGIEALSLQRSKITPRFRNRISNSDSIPATHFCLSSHHPDKYGSSSIQEPSMISDSKLGRRRKSALRIARKFICNGALLGLVTRGINPMPAIAAPIYRAQPVYAKKYSGTTEISTRNKLDQKTREEYDKESKKIGLYICIASTPFVLTKTIMKRQGITKREKVRVKESLEEMQTQMDEFMNVDGEAESDQDIFASLQQRTAELGDPTAEVDEEADEEAEEETEEETELPASDSEIENIEDPSTAAGAAADVSKSDRLAALQKRAAEIEANLDEAEDLDIVNELFQDDDDK
uniref:Uncharacterized protein n=1 Tax=Octactis speculum TaxID=3111310 RepID=A0A7S2GD18_9STRA